MPIAPMVLRKDALSPFLDVQRDNRRTFLTLGPEGTSSKQAAEHVAQLWGGSIALCDTYEEAALAVRDDPANNALLVANVLQHSDISIVETDSTHQAAAMTLRGEVDGCLTTRTAADLLGLETVASVIAAIPILWTIFVSKGCVA